MAERNTDIQSVFFRVEQRPVFMASSGQDQETKYKPIPRFQAIVDVDQNHVFSVVAEGYRLITNREAVELGKKCFCGIFSQSTAQGMTVFNIITPRTRSFCHLDFTHEGVGFEPWQGDKWVPFLRVTNSYNRMKPLRFDLGFCRWICTNGMIFGAKSITFRYVHTHEDIMKAEFHTTFGELKDMEKEFIERLHNLQRYYISEDKMLPLLCRVFRIKVSEEDFQRPKRQEQLLAFRSHVQDLIGKYIKEFGPNGYAALNLLTDFASRPNLYISQATMVDQLQKVSGEWMTNFLMEIKAEKFNWESYLGEYTDYAGVLSSAEAA